MQTKANQNSFILFASKYNLQLQIMHKNKNIECKQASFIKFFNHEQIKNQNESLLIVLWRSSRDCLHRADIKICNAMSTDPLFSIIRASHINLEISPKDRSLEVLHQRLRQLFIEILVVLYTVPGLQPKLHLLKIYEIVFAHRQLSANRIYFILLQIFCLSQANSHFIKRNYIFALNLINAFRLTFFFNQTKQFFDMTLTQFWKMFLFIIFQFLNKFYLSYQQQNQQTDNFFIYAILDGNTTILFKPDSRDVFQWFSARWINIVQKPNKVYFLFISVESKDYFNFILTLIESIFFQQHADMSSRDESLSPRDIVEQGKRMKICASCNCFSISLCLILLLFHEHKIAANAIEELCFFKFHFFIAALPLHQRQNNQLIIVQKYYSLLLLSMYPSRTFDNKHKHLIISVDDLGSDQSIDQVIYELLLNDRISNLSVIVNGSSFQNAAEKMEELKNKQKNKYLNCSIGLHFNLTEGKPLSDKIKQGKLTKNGEFLGKQKFYTEIINCEEICRDQISQQFRTQLRQFIKYFKRRPSHVDGHQNVHLVPKIAAILSDLMSESGIYRTQILELSMYRQEKELRQLFETYSIQSKNIYLKKNIAFASCFVRLSETNNLTLENIQKAFESQNLETINYKAVEAMYHPHSYVQQLEHQSNNSDSNSFIKEKDYLQSQHFLQIIKQFNGLSSYLDLRGKSSPQTPKLLIFSKMDVGTGNHTTTQRLKQIFQAIGYQVYLWSAVDQLNSDVEIADLQRFLMNFQISLIIGVNVTRTGQIIYEATHSKKPIRMDIPYFLVIAGTDANLSFGNQMQLKQLKNSLERSSCIISISEDMTTITKNVLQSLKIRKNIYTVTQSSCISQYLSYPTQSPSNYCPLNAKPFILFPTSFREVKCVHHLFKQLNQIITTNDIDVIIVGPILNQKYYEQCRYKLGAIKYLGVIKKQLYVRYLKEARLVINTSQSEGMSCSILQAFQVNVPVLARRNAGNQELIQHYDNGLLYDTPQHFLQLFNELNQNQSLRQKLVQNSSKLFKSKYSLQQQIASYQQIAKHQYQNKMYWMCNKTSFINVYNHESVHPTSEVNNSLFLQTKPIIVDGSYILDLGCGTGIFSLILLSRCAAKSIHLHLTDIDPEITGNALYNYRHSSIWQSIQSITCTESDMFTNIDKNIKFDVIIFNPPQTPFQHSESRPDKNGGIDAMKYYEPALKYFAESGGKQLFFLHSSMAWPVRFKQLLSKYKLKVQWTSTKGIHKIRAADYDLMEENLTKYILQHKAKGMADIQLVGEDFIVPAQIFNIVPQSQ